MTALSVEQTKEIERLWKLKESGALSADEFAELKARILNPNARPPPVQPLNPTEAERRTPNDTQAADHSRVYGGDAGPAAPQADVKTTSGQAASGLLSWVWVLFCGLVALGSLVSGGFLSACLFLVAGAMALRPLWRNEKVANWNVTATHRFIVASTAFLLATVMPGFGARETTDTKLTAAPTSLPAQTNYEIKLKAQAVSDNAVRYEVTTNLPLPVEVMADFSLSGLDDDETWIGYQEKVFLDRPTTTFTLDGSKSDKPLPAGTYDAEVSFYPRWGAEKNEKAKQAPDLQATQSVVLKGSGVTARAARGRNEKQRWVMGTVSVHDPWDEAAFAARLGRYEKRQAELSHLHDAYYFPEADMTIIVNRLLDEVTIWRMGRASR